MWFPNNKPICCREQKTQHNNQHHTCHHRQEACCNHRFPTPPGTARTGCGARVTAVIAWGKRPVPFRTRKLRPTAPMVLHPGGCGRVGHRRNTIRSRPPNTHVSGGLPHLTVQSLQTHHGGSPALTTPPKTRLNQTHPQTLSHLTRENPKRPRTQYGKTPNPAAAVEHPGSRAAPNPPAGARAFPETPHQVRERPT